MYVYRTQIAGGQKTHEEDVDKGILVGLLHVAKEIRALDFVDNAGGCRRKVTEVFRFGQHGRNIETGQQQREHGIAGTRSEFKYYDIYHVRVGGIKFLKKNVFN